MQFLKISIILFLFSCSVEPKVKTNRVEISEEKTIQSEDAQGNNQEPSQTQNNGAENNPQQPTQDNQDNTNTENQNSDSHQNEENPIVAMEFTKEVKINQNLGEKKIYTYTFTRSDSLEKDIEVKFSLDQNSIRTLDKHSAIQFKFPEEPYNMKPNESIEIDVEVFIDSMAPSISEDQNIEIKFNADYDGKQTSVSSSVIINPYYAIFVKGNSNNTIQWTPNNKKFSFIKHAQNLKIAFINIDTQSEQIIHGMGAIPHQDIGNPLEPAANGEELGGIYEVEIDANDKNASFYSHLYENSQQAKTMQFNLD